MIKFVSYKTVVLEEYFLLKQQIVKSGTNKCFLNLQKLIHNIDIDPDLSLLYPLPNPLHVDESFKVSSSN